MRTPRSSSCRLAALFVPSAIALAACGGSDDPPAAVDPAPGIALSLSGTAAIGAAIAGAPVEAKCNGGSGGATTQGDGSYTIELEQGALPCVLRVTAADGTVLHSLASGSGRSARSNLTPVSELVVANLAGADPAGYYAGFDPATLNGEKARAAADAVIDTLKSAGVDFSGISVLSGRLVAANGSSAGNAFDQALDALKSQLDSSGTTLVDLRDAMVRGTPNAAATALSNVPSLPAELLLRPATANCKALRSGKYRVVFAGLSEDPGEIYTDTITLDAATLRITGSDGVVDALVANGPCRFLVPSGGDLVVSPAGVGVVRSEEQPGRFALGIVFPEQKHPVSVTQGTWNVIGLGDVQSNNGGGVATLFTGDISFDAAGRATRSLFCDGVRDCVEEPARPEELHSVNAAGGFNYDNGRNFAYRAGGGEVMLVVAATDGLIALATRQAARVLPDIGSSSLSWNLTVTPQFSAQAAVSDSQSTVRSIDAAAGSYLRDAVIDFNTGVTRPERIEINRFLDGFFHRIPEAVVASNGSASTVGEWVALGLRGMGVTPVAILSNNNLVLSVTKPAQTP